jgi:lipid II:glycine glycyltransferase (peptidoglycan interpeptide bridge formation enzyme)
MIRKAIKLNLKSEINNDEYAFRFLIETHHENMQRIGGIPKENRFFESARKIFEKEKEYNLYIAYLHNKPIAAMLIFYFNKIVEYYIPAVKNEFRHMQPLSLLIALAIEDAAKKGYKYWNWGGTWLTQEGVYRFKKRWGARDHSYYYYTRIYDDNTLYLTKEELLREYPFFYVIPFKQLEKEKNEDCISLRRVTS